MRIGGFMPIRLFSPRYWPTWLGLGFLRLLALIPYEGSLRLGKVLGALVRHLPISGVRTARRNIELCLPELSAAQREKLLNQHFASLGVSVIETAFAWWASQKRAGELMQIEGA